MFEGPDVFEMLVMFGLSGGLRRGPGLGGDWKLENWIESYAESCSLGELRSTDLLRIFFGEESWVVLRLSMFSLMNTRLAKWELRVVGFDLILLSAILNYLLGMS